MQLFPQHLNIGIYTYVNRLDIVTKVTDNYSQTKMGDRMIRNRLLQVVNSTDKRVVESSFPPWIFPTVHHSQPDCDRVFRRKSTNVPKNGTTVLLEELDND